jgi:hypothetical protein
MSMSASDSISATSKRFEWLETSLALGHLTVLACTIPGYEVSTRLAERSTGPSIPGGLCFGLECSFFPTYFKGSTLGVAHFQ